MKIRSLGLFVILLAIISSLGAEPARQPAGTEIENRLNPDQRHTDTGHASDTTLITQLAQGGSTIKLVVSLAPALRDKARPNDQVFIYAKALSGPPMPLAAVRRQVRDLPLTITLDDSMAMLPQLRLSAFREVVVGARVSMTGNARAQPGDLQGEISPVTPGNGATIELVIDAVFPLSAT